MTTQPDVPPHVTEEEPEAPRPREPLDPIITPVWRLSRADRRRILTPFVDHLVKLERWQGRVASKGDQQYRGTVLSIASTTLGSAADLLILRTVDGTDWAISTAQIAYLELLEPPRKGPRP